MAKGQEGVKYVQEGYTPKNEVAKSEAARAKAAERAQDDARNAAEQEVAKLEKQYGNPGDAKKREGGDRLDLDAPL